MSETGSETKRPRRRRGMARQVAVVFVSALMLGVINLAISYAIVKQSERKWCGLVTTLADGYTAPDSPPPTERGRKIGEDLAALRRSFGC